jgi:hypothetical protein
MNTINKAKINLERNLCKSSMKESYAIQTHIHTHLYVCIYIYIYIHFFLLCFCSNVEKADDKRYNARRIDTFITGIQILVRLLAES